MLKVRSFIKRSVLVLKLIGSSSEFSLESRIFHSISIGLIILCSIYVPYNLYAGLLVGSISALIIGAFFFYQYYSSRFNGRPHNSSFFGIMGILIFSVNYFTNSGIDGSTDLIWPAYLLLVFAISPYSQHTKWLIIYLLCFFIIHGIEYYYPFLVEHPFYTAKGRFIDRITVFPMPVITIYIIIKFIRRSYDRERKIIENKSLAVEKSKLQIQSQKDQLERSNVEKSKLMSIISHDLRTPLLNVQNYLELLNNNQLESKDRPEIEKALLNSTNNAMEMLSNLLHWSNSQMEGPHVNLQEVSLLTALYSTLEIEKTHAQKKDISLNYNISPDIKVVVDVDMLQLVIRNIISNAIKFTSNRGHIQIDAELAGKDCKIIITDDGKGMTEEQKQRVFSIKLEPAYGTNNERGVGLGLVLCKEYIECQSGRIEFESNLGSGSRFFVFVPSNNNYAY